jgi:NADH:ubiquinone oxidoreductase subunit 6 (subunit J)
VIQSLVTYIIAVVVLNLILVMLGKFFGQKEEVKNKEGHITAYRRRSLVLALGCYLVLAVIDVVFILWILSIGPDQIFGVEDFLRNLFE